MLYYQGDHLEIFYAAIAMSLMYCVDNSVVGMLYGN